MAPVGLRFWIGEVQILTTATRLPTTNPIMTVPTMIRRTTAALMLAARIMAAPTAAVSMAAEVIIDYDSQIGSAEHCAGANSRPASPLRSDAVAGARPEEIVSAGVPLGPPWFILDPLVFESMGAKFQVDGVFSVEGLGTALQGTIISGEVSIGMLAKIPGAPSDYRITAVAGTHGHGIPLGSLALVLEGGTPDARELGALAKGKVLDIE